MTRLDSVLKTVKEKVGASESEENIAIAHLEEINTGVARLHTFAGLYTWIWLAFPAVCCFIALFWDKVFP